MVYRVLISILMFSPVALATEPPPDRTCEKKSAWGFVDLKGKSVVPHQFSQVKGFSNGLAAVKSKKGLWGYVDKKGRWAIPAKFQDADALHAGQWL